MTTLFRLRSKLFNAMPLKVKEGDKIKITHTDGHIMYFIRVKNKFVDMKYDTSPLTKSFIIKYCMDKKIEIIKNHAQ